MKSLIYPTKEEVRSYLFSKYRKQMCLQSYLRVIRGVK